MMVISIITYFLSSGCQSTVTVTVNSMPAPIGGSPVMCQGSGTILTDPGGGIWSSSNGAVATIGSVSGISAGTAIITYTLGSGCIATQIITVNPLPSAIAGLGSICIGSAT